MSNPPRIVIADDSADLRLLLKNILDLEGFEVVGEAADGEEAVALVRQLLPDAILLDLGMPKMSGAEAIPSIKNACPDAKIVILSGNSDEATSTKSLGVDAVLLKGTDLKEIVQALRTLLGTG